MDNTQPARGQYKWAFERRSARTQVILPAACLALLLAACSPMPVTVAAPVSTPSSPAVLPTPAAPSATNAEQAPEAPAPAAAPEVSLAGVPTGWSVAGRAWKRYTVARDTAVVRSGRASVRITAQEGMTMTWPTPFASSATVFQTIDAKPWLGKRVRLSAWVKVDNTIYAVIWLRVNAERMVQFDNMGGRPIQGISTWVRHDVVLDVPLNSRSISFGALLNGGGQMWADDFELHDVSDSDVHSTNLYNPGDVAKLRLTQHTPDHPQATNRGPIEVPHSTARNLGFEE